MEFKSEDFQAVLHIAQNLGFGTGAVALLKSLFGDAAIEVKAIVASRLRMNHFAAQIRMFGQANQMLQEAGINPKPVSLKLLVPMMDGASLEEDEELSRKWSALLANSVSYQDQVVQPAFIQVLKELTVSQANMLDVLFKIAPGKLSINPPSNFNEFHAESINLYWYLLIIGIQKDQGNSHAKALLDLNIMQRVGLLSIMHETKPNADGIFEFKQFAYGEEKESDGIKILLTHFGHAFVVACSPPIVWPNARYFDK